MNWGHKITIVILIFIVSMTGMVFVAMRQTNDMEDTAYYEKELQYQSKIDAAQNLYASGNYNLLTQNASAVIVSIPQGLLTGFEKGQLEFLKTDDKRKDLIMNFAPDNNGVFMIPRSKFSSGFYKARIGWHSGQKQYYREQSIILQ